MADCCSVCCENWSKTVIKTECSYCKFGACSKCLKTYLLGLPEDPRCMAPDCKRTWTVEHVCAMLSPAFVNGAYKKHRETVLYDREMAMLPATQPFVEELVIKTRLMAELDQIEEEIKRLRAYSRDLVYQIQVLNNRPGIDGNRSSERDAAQHVGRCAIESCKGFVMTSSYACGICEAKYCKRCFMMSATGVDGSQHECKQEDIDTFTMIKKDSKPCPSCATLIFKISGCSQMFCTKCNTAWDWNTFKITSNISNIHNPHYFEWRAANAATQATQATQAAEAAEAPRQFACRNEFAYQRLEIACNSLVTVDRAYILKMYGVIRHMRAVEIGRRYAVDDTPLFDRNLDVRIKYLQNQMDEKKMRSLLHAREKANNKKREISQVLMVFADVGLDILTEFIQNNRSKSVVAKVRSQFDSIVTYCDESLTQLAERYKCVIPNIANMIEMRK